MQTNTATEIQIPIEEGTDRNEVRNDTYLKRFRLQDAMWFVTKRGGDGVVQLGMFK